jgi:ATP-dependent RNA helicase DeaD
VATPGRMQDMINRGLVNISQIDYCILDRLTENEHGLLRRYRKHLINYTRRKNTWLFSATMPAEVAVLENNS